MKIYYINNEMYNDFIKFNYSNLFINNLIVLNKNKEIIYKGLPLTNKNDLEKLSLIINEL